MILLEIIFWTSLFFLFYIYDGYLRVLLILSRLFVSTPQQEQNRLCFPTVTVLVTVHNEKKTIRQKINNILDCDYPEDRLEIMVASDGSTDGTETILQEMNHPKVVLFRPEIRVGKTDTQNQAMNHISSDIVIFTDADTLFDVSFLRKITLPFSDPDVGAVDGHLLFTIDRQSVVSQSQGFYWSYELRLRLLESRLGILAVSSGACLAVRKTLFKPMEAAYGEDCIIPLDIISQGYKILHEPDAIAYDKMDYAPEKEFNNRVRMTIRNLQGTFSRKELINPFFSPRYAFSLWSHKILRWLSPIFFILMSASALILAITKSFYGYVSITISLFLLVSLVGKFAETHHLSLPVVRIVYSFMLANYGFLVGIIRTLKKDRITSYRNSSPPDRNSFDSQD